VHNLKKTCAHNFTDADDCVDSVETPT